MIFVNFKTYEQGTGSHAVALAEILETVAAEYQVKIVPVVQAMDIRDVASHTKLEIWAQKIDPVTFGAYTGAILAEAVLEDGAVGTFVNHSESRLENTLEIKKIIDRAVEVGLKTLVFAGSLEELKKVAEFKPTYVAYEPPELIGSTTVSVAEAKPEVISRAVEIAKSYGLPLIVGAGVHTRNDVKKSLELGAVGVAVAKDILMADDPRKEIVDLVEGFK